MNRNPVSVAEQSNRRNLSIREFVAVSLRLGFRPRWAAGILCLNLGAIVFEGIGIGIFLPILEFMNNSGDVAALSQDSRMWATIVDVTERLSFPLTLGSLLAIAFCCLLIRQAFTYCRLIYLARIQSYFLWVCRNQAFRRFMGATLLYHDTVRTGDFVNEVNTELNRAADRKSTRLNSSHITISYAVFCLKKNKKKKNIKKKKQQIKESIQYQPQHNSQYRL